MFRRPLSGLSLSGLVWLLFAMALAMRAAVPAGWMPQVHDGAVQIAICTGDGQQQMLVLEADGTLHKEQPQPVQPRDPCPFGMAAGHALDLPPPVTLPVLLPLPAARAAHALVTARLVASRTLRPPARGPPLPA